MKIKLSQQLKDRLKREGFSIAQAEYEIDNDAYLSAFAHWSSVSGEHDAHEEALFNALTHPSHGPLYEAKPVLVSDPVPSVPDYSLHLVAIRKAVEFVGWAIIGLLLFIALLTIIAPHAHAQKDSQIYTIKTQNQGASLKTFAGPFTINCSTNMTCSTSGSTFTLTASSTAGTAWSGLTAPAANLALTMAHFSTTWTFDATTGASANMLVVTDTLNNTGTGYLFAVNTASGSAAKPVNFCVGGTTNCVGMTSAGIMAPAGTAHLNADEINGVSIPSANSGTAGKIPIAQGDGTAAWSDPLVQGTQAAGSTTLPNPVGVGGSDYGGTPTLRALKVDSSGQAYIGNFPATQAISAASLPLPTGAATSAKQPALGTAGTAATDVITVQGISSMTKLLVTPDSVALPANQSVNVNQIGGTAVVADPCQANAKLYVSINQTANTKLVTGTAAKKIYICSFHVVVAGADNVALVEGTGTACATGTTGVTGFGGATAATGWNFAANSGISQGNGTGALGAEGTAADDLCLYVSAAVQASGGMSYVVQ